MKAQTMKTKSISVHNDGYFVDHAMPWLERTLLSLNMHPVIRGWKLICLGLRREVRTRIDHTPMWAKVSLVAIYIIAVGPIVGNLFLWMFK
ncbi:MAG: hypothetical protein V4697_04225 [Patescibacteria group bacterium]